ncbi:metallophosphoesterase [Nocardioides sp. KIGAM211]|uniref:Metallophosphoesterase n=1 Tax=Nocardioides luti TaxID=2761101 RepID=A0A7X0RHX8_9ACTN|nr:metallophosphoesterase [Nocardioides luti]
MLASHDAVLRPNLTGQVVVHTGPVLPDFRRDSGHRIGVDIRLGKTEAQSTDELVQRYAYIASQPEGQVAKVREALADMAYAAAVRAAVIGLLPVLVWLLVGRRRRRELLVRSRSPGGLVAAATVALLVIGVWEPWTDEEDTVEEQRPWTSLATFLGPEVRLPDEVQGIEVRGDVTTQQTRRLVESAIATYDKSKQFYATAARQAANLGLRVPEPGDTVVTLVSDRHDNIGMDAVARAIGDAGGATATFDAGDDTSSGKSWEAFSLDSVTAAFDDLDRWGVAGNHDNGTFVRRYLADRGWRMLDGEAVDGPGGSTLLGVDDPRASGLGAWREETGLSFEEVGSRLSDVACDSDERVATILVHDANLAREALARGCADLVVGGHLHVQVGPTRVVGSNGEAGYSYTTGTTGGAAYAIAVGSKPKREAEVTLITYRDGRPVGLQPVTLQTNGVFEVGDYVPLHLAGDAQK